MKSNKPNPSGQSASPLLDRYKQMAEGIAALFFPYVEVVIHDLCTQTVAYLANNLSKRAIGDDSALDDIEFDISENVIGPYEKINWDGKKIRSVSVVARDDDQTPIGLMCINFQVSAIEHAQAVLTLLLTGTKAVPQPEKLFRDDWQERINTFLNGWLQTHHLSFDVLNRDHKRQIVQALYSEGAFEGKSAANYVANVLGLGRATVFKYLRILRVENGV